MKLILFFNGWGVSKERFKNLDSNGYELKIIELEERIDLKKLKKYKEIYVIAWSFGVYNASEQLTGIKINKAIAINGTTKCIDRRCGISPIIFRKTVNNLDRENYLEFMKNTGITLFDDSGWENQKEILRRFGENYIEIPSIFEMALISTKDRIFSKRSLINFYRDSAYKLIEEEHHPFDRWNSWKEVLDEF